MCYEIDCEMVTSTKERNCTEEMRTELRTVNTNINKFSIL